MRKQFVFVAALAAAGVGVAETFTWMGAEDAYWTNAANWTVGGGESGQDWHVSSAGGVFKVGVRKGMLLIVK